MEDTEAQSVAMVTGQRARDAAITAADDTFMTAETAANNRYAVANTAASDAFNATEVAATTGEDLVCFYCPSCRVYLDVGSIWGGLIYGAMAGVCIGAANCFCEIVRWRQC